MAIVAGTIRTDNEDVPYLENAPADGIIHVAYQDYEVSDIGTTYTKLYSTDERHMVNAINHMYGTSHNWGELRGKSVEFFTPEELTPITRLKFSKVGIYYVADVVVDKTLDLDELGVLVNIDEMSSRIDFPVKDVLYYSSKDNQNPLRQFVRANFSTDKLSFNPSRDVDFTLMHLGDDDFLTPVVIHNYSNGGGYSTLLFKNEVLPAIGLSLSTYSKPAILAALSGATGVALTSDNYLANDVIRVFDPYQDIDDVYTIFKLQRGTDVKYFAATAAVTESPVAEDDEEVVINCDGATEYAGFTIIDSSDDSVEEGAFHSVEIGGLVFNGDNSENIIGKSYVFDASNNGNISFFDMAEDGNVGMESRNNEDVRSIPFKLVPPALEENNNIHGIYITDGENNPTLVYDEDTRGLSGCIVSKPAE